MRLGHCADLQSQLRELAEDLLETRSLAQSPDEEQFVEGSTKPYESLQEFEEMLGGTSEERYNLLIASLKEAKARGVSV